eukprot:TRINITY_DN1262_c0_g1_i3.p1 TRINITY_DN1262_c0_g1~~TRINITY_DN1262_c0_g1_i3.p1  ORF type:complete len:587 (-),score=117.91 TRINITY_DN1262_c0_g1_i3:7-1581(-)
MSASEAPPLQIVAVKSYAGPKKGESIPTGLVPPVGPLSFKKKQIMTLVDWNEEYDYILGCYRADGGKQRRGWFPASNVRVVQADASSTTELLSPRYIAVGGGERGGSRSMSVDPGMMRVAGFASPTGSDSSDSNSDGRSSSGEVGPSTGLLSPAFLHAGGGRAGLEGEGDSLEEWDKSERMRSARWKSAGNLKADPLVLVDAPQTARGDRSSTASSSSASQLPEEATARLSHPSMPSQPSHSIPALRVQSGSRDTRKKSDASNNPHTRSKAMRAQQTLEDLLKGTRSASVAGPDSNSIPLNAVQPVDKRGIPVLVTSIIKHLRSHGLTEENLFRASGHGQEVRELKRAFMNEENVDLSKTRNIHSSAAVLKLFLRELSEPLLTYDLHESFTASLALPTEERRLEHFKYLLELLPPQNYNLTACLAGFLYETVQLANENSLTLVQASRIFGQSFCRQSTYTIDRDELEKSYLYAQCAFLLPPLFWSPRPYVRLASCLHADCFFSSSSSSSARPLRTTTFPESRST